MTSSTPYSILADLEKVDTQKLPPIHLWDPEDIKDIDMQIRRDGSWWHLGTPIERQRMVHLFSTVLRKEDNGDYYLVTPVEKCRIDVEDVPFQAILLEVTGSDVHQVLTFTTNVADKVTVDSDHPLRFTFDPETEEPSPYVLVRDNLEARLSRNVYYQLANLCVQKESESGNYLGVWSSGIFFNLLRI